MNEYDIIKAWAEGSTSAVVEKLPNILTPLLKLRFRTRQIVDSSPEERKSIIDALCDLHMNIKDLSPSQLQPIVKDIGVPLLDKLAYIEEVSTRRLYIAALSYACQKDKQKFIHPRIINIIPNLSSAEILLFKNLSLSKEEAVIVMRYNVVYNSAKPSPLMSIAHIFPLSFDDDEAHSHLDNLRSIGLLNLQESEARPGLIAQMDKFKSEVFTNYKFNLESTMLCDHEKEVVRGLGQYHTIQPSVKQYAISPLGYLFSELLFNQSDAFQDEN